MDRRFNRSKYDVESVVDEFAGSLQDRVDPDVVIEGWVEVVAETMQPSSVGVWLRQMNRPDGSTPRNAPVPVVWHNWDERSDMVHYMFETEWVLTAPVERVFELLSHPEGYASWWPSVKESALLDEGDAAGVGRSATYTVRGPWYSTLRLQVRAIEMESPHRVRNIVRGDLVGTGTHHLETHPKGTRVRFHWYVSTTSGLVNTVARLARPAFSYAHKKVMYEGCEGMARSLGAKLLMARSTVVESPTPIPLPQS